MSPRIHDGSPVIWTIEHISAGILTSSSTRAIVASSSSNGAPACGFRGAVPSCMRSSPRWGSAGLALPSWSAVCLVLDVGRLCPYARLYKRLTMRVELCGAPARVPSKQKELAVLDLVYDLT